MNKLYGLLVDGAQELSGWYAKLYTPVVHSARSKVLRDQFTAGVPDARLPLFACVVCKTAVNSMFRDEILALDPDNTYGTVMRNPDAVNGSGNDVMYDLLSGHETMHRLFKHLDADILDRLSVPTWTETASAVCLQLLRSAL